MIHQHHTDFLAIHSFEKTKFSDIGQKLIMMIPKASLFTWIFYMLLPYYTLVSYCNKTRILLKIQNSVISLIHLIIIDIFTVFFYITGPLKTMILGNTDLLEFPTSPITWSFYTVVQPMVIFLLTVIFFITIYCKPFENLTIITNRQMNRNNSLLNQNIRLIFHSYKNTLFTIERLSLQGNKMFDKNPEITKENLNDINALAKSSLDSVTRKLNMLSSVNSTNNIANIEECIKEAIERVSSVSHLKIIKSVKTDKLNVRGDAYISRSALPIFF